MIAIECDAVTTLTCLRPLGPMSQYVDVRERRRTAGMSNVIERCVVKDRHPLLYL
jgi:hypothetical protein